MAMWLTGVSGKKRTSDWLLWAMRMSRGCGVCFQLQVAILQLLSLARGRGSPWKERSSHSCQFSSQEGFVASRA